MQKLVEEEQEKREAERRRSERATAAMNVEKRKPESDSSSLGKWNCDKQQKGSNIPSCMSGGHAPDGHDRFSCPNGGLKYCYGCHTFGKHIKKNCPNLRDNESTDGRRSDNRVNKDANKFKRPIKKSGGRPSFKKAPFKRFQQVNKQRKSKGKILLTYTSSEEDDDNVYVDANDLSTDEYVYLFIENKGDGSANTVFGWYLNITNSSVNVVTFILDCGATDHLVNRLDVFTNLQKLLTPRKFTCANKNAKANLTVWYSGDAILRNTETNELIKLKNVNYSPDVPHNFFSALKVKEKLSFLIDGNETYVIEKKSKRLMQVAHSDGRFWRLNFEIPASEVKPCEREAHLMKTKTEEERFPTMKIHDSIFNLSLIHI